MSAPVRLERFGRRGHRPNVGDVFTAHVLDRGWLYGRVVAVDAIYEPWSKELNDGVLVYLFNRIDAVPEMPDRLLVTALLRPPFIVTPTIWSKGLVRHVGARQFLDGERLQKHCFEIAGSSVGPKYVDERGNGLSERIEPCGTLALVLDLGLEWEIAEGLAGLKRGSP